MTYNLKNEIFIDPTRLRPSEVPLLIGRNEKITQKTGWLPIRTVIDIIKEGVQYFQEHQEQLGIEAH
jgi:GDP-4-dehydro-6-deoxy-D-mannose reductase